MPTLRSSRRAALCVLAAALALHAPAARTASFDFDTGNAPIEVIIPNVIPAIFASVGGGDASLILRYTTLITNGWFDGIAPYQPSAVGVYSHLGHRPPAEQTIRNKNIAILYASYRVLNSLFPGFKTNWRTMMSNVNLNPDDNNASKQNPIGIGNLAGAAVVAFREHDGDNQLGDEGGRLYSREPYRDYTGYTPVNTAYYDRSVCDVYRVRDGLRAEPLPGWGALPVITRDGAKHLQAHR